MGGKTYSEIQKYLKVSIPKSTLSYLRSEVVMPQWYQKKIDALNKRNFSLMQKMAWVSNQLKREKVLRDLTYKCELLKPVVGNKNVLKLMLAFLYLGEGAKWKRSPGPMLGSADPIIVLLYIKLLDLCYAIPIDKLRVRISYRADQNLRALERYWSRVTGIPRRHFYKTKPDSRTVGKPTFRSDYKGVCAIYGGGTALQRELEMIPKYVLEQITSRAHS